MKLENATAVGAVVISLAIFGAIDAPPWITVIGVSVSAFLGWQTGCLYSIYREYKGTKDPDPMYTPTGTKQSDGRYIYFPEEGRDTMPEWETKRPHSPDDDHF